MTHRQYTGWHRWLEMQQNRPSRTDAYLIQLTCLLHNINSKRRARMGDFHLSLSPDKVKPDVQKSKRRWLGFVGGKGMKIHRRIRLPDGTVVDKEDSDG